MPLHTHTLRKVLGIFILFVFLNLQSLVFSQPAFAYYTNMNAGVVLGQPDFTSSSTNQGSSSPSQSSMSGPTATFSDGQRLFLTDFTNNRVLIWNSIPTINNTPADIVLGQPDFVSSTANNGGISASTLNQPSYVFSDGSRLVVSDRLNHRVLLWNSIPTRNQQPADVVVGQPDFVTSSAGTTASKFNVPFGVFIYNGKLIISEISNNRIVIYNSIPTTNGASADTVVGNSNFTTIAFGPSASRFGKSGTYGPRGIFVYNNKLIVSDNPNNRVLIFDPFPTSNNASANIVIGQPDFTSNTADNGGISCASLNSQEGLLVTPNGRLFLGETSRYCTWTSKLFN